LGETSVAAPGVAKRPEFSCRAALAEDEAAAVLTETETVSNRMMESMMPATVLLGIAVSFFI
jgi:hypothetical protein